MYVTINYNMYTICIRNTTRSKLIPLLCTHVYSYMFRKVHPPGIFYVLFKNIKKVGLRVLVEIKLWT